MTYTVYKHPVFGNQAVKNGFSAFAFFFPLLWSLANKVWGVSGAIFVWFLIAAGVAMGADSRGDPGFQLFVQSILFHLPAGVFYGLNGNKMLASHFVKQGYSQVANVRSASPEAAIGQYVTNGPASSPVSGANSKWASSNGYGSGLVATDMRKNPTDVSIEQNAPNIPTLSPVSGASDLSDQLSKLHNLKQQGVLSEAEFQAAKAKLLS